MKFNWEQKNTVNVITGVLIFTISILCYFIFSNKNGSYLNESYFYFIALLFGDSIPSVS